MDRTAFAACALLLAPVALSAGCGARQSAEPQAEAPRVLAELQEASPGPWRSREQGQVSPTSLERPVEARYRPAVLDETDLRDLQARMNPAPVVEDETSAAPWQTAADSAEIPVVEPAEPGPQAASEQQPAAGPFPALIDPTPTPGEPLHAASEPRTLDAMLPSPAATSERLPTTIPPLPPERGAVPWAGKATPSLQMRAVLEQSEQRLRLGFQLAERGALYLARAEFVAVLELIAQAHDLERDTQFHTKSLVAGLAALEESGDFVRRRPVGKQLDMALVVGGHRTKILQEEDLESISPLAAARRYYTYAQEQLAGAAAGESRSSIALYGLGKIVTTGAEAGPSQRLEMTAQAMVWHQAALMADRSNFRAANELGVLLARNGDLLHARNLLIHSVSLSKHPSTFRNLATVHARLGETELAERAMSESLALERAGYRRQGPAVQWVDAEAFAGSARASDSTLPPVNPAAPGSTEPKSEPAATTAQKSGSWLPWSTRR